MNTSTLNLADEPTLADGPPSELLLTSSGQEWQFHIATDVSVVKNGNFTLLLTSHGQEWQFHIATDISWSRMAI